MRTARRPSILTSAGALARDLEDPQLRVIDCRFDLMAPAAGRQAWLDGHIPGAVYADLDRDLSGPIVATGGRHPLPAVQDAVETFSRLGVDEHTRVVVYDAAGGAIAARAWWLLRWLGHRAVTVLDGGLQAWTASGRPLDPGEQRVARREFRGRADPDRVLTTQQVVDNLDNKPGMPLIDAREAARFIGESEPIDTRAGHVPGALNLPYGECLREDATWHGAETLRARLAPVLGADRDAPWAVMCGSGVTACHLAISGRLAGYREPRVYVGSWSEWIRDPARPVATGAPVSG